jgi:cytochrome c6
VLREGALFSLARNYATVDRALGRALTTIHKGERTMKTILKLSFGLVALALLTSTYTFADAAADYKAKCAMCHGANGEGKAAMKTQDLGSADVQKMSDDQLTNIITKGDGKMPGYDGKLSKDQISDLVKWIRTLKK